MKHCFHIIAIALLALLAACASKTDVPQIIDDAEHLADAGKFDEALGVCDRLVTTADSSLLTATQYCRVAVIYAIAADNDIDNDANMAKAMRSFRSANAINRDSVSAFVDNLTLERLSAVRTVLQLLRSQNDDLSDIEDIEELAAQQFISDEQLDSIYNNEQ
jgi:hypothetical protein